MPATAVKMLKYAEFKCNRSIQSKMYSSTNVHDRGGRVRVCVSAERVQAPRKDFQLRGDGHRRQPRHATRIESQLKYSVGFSA